MPFPNVNRETQDTSRMNGKKQNQHADDI